MNNDNVTFEEIPQACFASGSIPVVFPPQLFHGRTLMDGGTVWNINVESAVNQCLDMGYAEEDIIFDVIICANEHPSAADVSKDALTNFMSGHADFHFYHDMNSL